MKKLAERILGSVNEAANLNWVSLPAEMEAEVGEALMEFAEKNDGLLIPEGEFADSPTDMITTLFNMGASGKPHVATEFEGGIIIAPMSQAEWKKFLKDLE